MRNADISFFPNSFLLSSFCLDFLHFLVKVRFESLVRLDPEFLVFSFRQLQRHFMTDLSGMSQNLVFIELHPAIQTKTVLRTELRIFQEIQGILPEMSFSGDVLPD